jgi:hypothetical protein
VVIGRGEECTLPLDDTSVSRVHAELHAIEGGKYEIVDRESSNGVRVNGVELKRALLDAGDVIELGDVQLKLVAAGQIFHAQEPLPYRPGLGTGPHTPPSRTSLPRVVAIAVIVVAAAVAVTTLSRGGREPPVTGSPGGSAAARSLETAGDLLAAGQIEEALRLAQEIPEDSNLRESATFREIQTRWADSLFEHASRELDRTRKRSLLERVARSPEVGSIQRKRAANEIALLDADIVGIDDLPAAPRGVRNNANPPNPAPTRAPSARKPALPSDPGGDTPC